MAAYYTIALLLCMLIFPFPKGSAILFREGTAEPQHEAEMILYINQLGSGPNRNQVAVISTSEPLAFGTAGITNWSILDGPDGGASIVGRAQGIHFQSSHTGAPLWTSIFNLKFDNGTFAGSTLQVMGFVPTDGDWSILGGTGKLTLARGIISHKVIRDVPGDRLYEVYMHVYYSAMGKKTVFGVAGSKTSKRGLGGHI